MDSISRRKFITRSAAGIAGATLFLPELLRANPLKLDPKMIGFQTWVVRDDIKNDFAGMMKKMAGYGFNSFELCSPPSYADAGFGGLQKYSATELKKMINDAGFTCPSCHYGFSELKDNGPERIEWAQGMGHKQMVVSSFGLPKDATLDDWKKSADDMNKIGELTKKSGIQLGYHNHDMEFAKLDGQLIYDVLLQHYDADLVKLQFQVQVIMLGYKAADYFRKYPGRFISAHLYDWTGKDQELAALGKGVVDWDDFFAAAKVGGLNNCFVEMGEPYLADSAAFLKARA